MNFTVKGIPDKVYQVIQRGAKREGRSVNSEIIKLLEAEAAERERRRRMRRLREKLDEFAAAIQPLDDSAPLIRQDRRR